MVLRELHLLSFPQRNGCVYPRHQSRGIEANISFGASHIPFVAYRDLFFSSFLPRPTDEKFNKTLSGAGRRNVWMLRLEL